MCILVIHPFYFKQQLGECQLNFRFDCKSHSSYSNIKLTRKTWGERAFTAMFLISFYRVNAMKAKVSANVLLYPDPCQCVPNNLRPDPHRFWQC